MVFYFRSRTNQGGLRFHHDCTVEVAYVIHPGESEGHHHLGLDYPQDVFHASLAASRHGVRPGPSDHAGTRSHGHRLHDVEAAANTPVHQDLALAAYGVGDARERANARGYVVELTPTVVRDDHGVGPTVHCLTGVVGVEDALQCDLAAPMLAQPREVVPGHAGIELSCDPGLEVARHASIRQRLFQVAKGEGSSTEGDVAHPPGVREEIGTSSKALRARDIAADPVSRIAVTLTDDGQVNGEDQRRAPDRLGPGHQIFGITAVFHDVELEPDGA